MARFVPLKRPITLAAAGALIVALGASTLVSGQMSARHPWSDGEFYFTRLAYRSDPGMDGWRGDAWLTDYPDAELHLIGGLTRLTGIDIAQQGAIVSLDDDKIMDYPWLYAVEVGRWSLNNREAARLREYLLRGGFLMVDDFWGTVQWNVFFASMRRVFPDRPIIDIPESDPLLHVFYDVDQRIQIPGRNLGYQQDGDTPYWRGIYDDQNRLMVAINFNMDMGDAWEHADDPWYPEPMTALAYRFAVNYVIYAMTH